MPERKWHCNAVGTMTDIEEERVAAAVMMASVDGGIGGGGSVDDGVTVVDENRTFLRVWTERIRELCSSRSHG